MNMVIILEIVVGIVVLAAAVRFAVRDTRRRRGTTGSEGAGEAPSARGDERGAQQHPSEVADRREGEEVAALSAPSTASSTVLEPPADTR